MIDLIAVLVTALLAGSELAIGVFVHPVLSKLQNAAHAEAAKPLARLLADLYDPISPRYHQFVTPEQFTAMFGPTPEDYDAVAAFAQAHGLIVTGRHANRMILDVRGSEEAIEQALHVM
jgi:subtilase family serine protease